MEISEMSYLSSSKYTFKNIPNFYDNDDHFSDYE